MSGRQAGLRIGGAVLETIAGIGVLQALGILATAGRAKVIAMLLGPEGVGVVGVIDQLVLVVMHVTTLSLPFSALTFMSRSYGRTDAFRRTYAAFLAVVSTMTLGGTALALLAVVARREWLGANLAAHQPTVVVALLSVPLLAGASFGASVLAAARRARRAALTSAVSAVALFLATVGGLIVGGLGALYWAMLVGGGLVAAWTFATLRSELALPVTPWRNNAVSELGNDRDLVFFCLSYFVVSSAYPLAWLIARGSVLESFGAAEAGLLQAVVALTAGFGMVLRPVNAQLLLPLVSGPEATSHKFRQTVEVQRRLLVGLALLAMPIVLFPRWFLTVLYSDAFTPAVSYVYLFVLAEVILVVATSCQVLIMGLGDLKVWALVFVVGYAILGALAWTLGAAQGILGVAVAALAASTLIFVLAVWWLRTTHGFRLPSDVGRLLVFVLAAILAAGAGSARYDDGGPVALVTKTAVLLVFAAGVLWCLNAEDRARVSHLLARLQLRST